MISFSLLHQRSAQAFFSVAAALLLSFFAAQASARTVSPFPEELGLGSFRGQAGAVLYYTVTGSTSGSVWGSNPYTDDSSLAKAAVHAGLFQAGQKGVIKVTIMAGQSSYPGSTANGVTSSSYGSYGGSFSVAADHGGDNPAIPSPGSMTGFRSAAPGSVYRFTTTGASSGSLWGTNVFTDDSGIAIAAVHAGVLRTGQSGTVRVVTSPGQSAYVGSTRNGVSSSGYGTWASGYTVSDTTGATALHPYPGMQGNPLPDPGSMTSFRGRNGASLYFLVTGTTSGSLWGSGTYTDDSSLATAVVHAGVAGAGQTQVVKATILAGQSSYDSSMSNGVTSSSYGSWSGSFAVAAPDGAMGTIPAISSALSAGGSEGQAFAYTIAATQSPSAFGATGLPEGLTVDNASGRIGGTPKVSGVFRVEILATNASGTSNAELVLTVVGSGATPVTSTASADCLFDWAEKNYADLFAPARAPSRTYDVYYYRYYSATNSYLAVAGVNKRVFYIGALSGGSLLDVGDTATWLTAAGCQ
jgi:hypothetical protein